MSKLIRLYPRNPQLGFVLRSYTILEPPLRFLESRGWYEVSDEVAAKLKDVPQQDRLPGGARAFLVAADKAEAKELDARVLQMVRKSKKQEQIGTAEEPVAMARPGARTERSPKTRTRKKKIPED